MTFILAPKRKQVIFCIESCIHNCLPDSGKVVLFLGLSKCFPESDFYLPRGIGQVLMYTCSTLMCDLFVLKYPIGMDEGFKMFQAECKISFWGVNDHKTVE